MAILNTANQGLPYPDDSEAIKDVPEHIQALAEAVEGQVVQRWDSISDRGTKVPSPEAGMLGWMTDTNRFVFYDGTTWVRLWPPIPTVSSGTEAPTGDGTSGDLYIRY